jgi:mitogen-activated protein kinase organizer 1
MDCALTPSDAHVIGSSEDGQVYFWDLVDGGIVSTLAAHGAVVTSLAVHPSGDGLATCSVDGCIKYWR